METTTLSNDPMNAMRYPKNGIDKATVTMLSIRSVLVKHGSKLLWYSANLSSMAFAMGVTMSAYFVRGFTTVVYIAIFELMFPMGRFNVTWDFRLSPYMRYPMIAIDP